MDDKKKEIVKTAVGKVEMHDMSRKRAELQEMPARPRYPSLWLTCQEAPFMKGAKAGDEMTLIVKACVRAVESHMDADSVKNSYEIDVVEAGRGE